VREFTKKAVGDGLDAALERISAGELFDESTLAELCGIFDAADASGHWALVDDWLRGRLLGETEAGGLGNVAGIVPCVNQVLRRCGPRAGLLLLDRMQSEGLEKDAETFEVSGVRVSLVSGRHGKAVSSGLLVPSRRFSVGLQPR
jgi:hypothetical protein